MHRLSIYLPGVGDMDGLLLNLKVEIGTEVLKKTLAYYSNPFLSKSQVF